MFIFTGVTQVYNGPIVQLEIDLGHGGEKVQTKAFVTYTNSHYNNQWLYAEYIKSCILPNLAIHGCCADPDCKSILYLHDDAPMGQGTQHKARSTE